MKTVAITGVLGYSGRYVANEAVRRGWRVIGLTNSAGRLPNPARYELRPMPWSPGGESALRGVDVLVNTYWVRFSFNGAGHAAFSHSEAVDNTLTLFRAAQQAGRMPLRLCLISVVKLASSKPWLILLCPIRSCVRPFFSGIRPRNPSLSTTWLGASGIFLAWVPSAAVRIISSSLSTCRIFLNS